MTLAISIRDGARLFAPRSPNVPVVSRSIPRSQTPVWERVWGKLLFALAAVSSAACSDDLPASSTMNHWLAQRIGDPFPGALPPDRSVIVMIEQLVGQRCVQCQNTIDSIVEGDYCLACAQPVHWKCVCPGIGHFPERCEQCGSMIDDTNAVQRRLDELRNLKSAIARQIDIKAAHGSDYGRQLELSRESGRTGVYAVVCIILFMISIAAGLTWLVMEILQRWSGIRC